MSIALRAALLTLRVPLCSAQRNYVDLFSWRRLGLMSLVNGRLCSSSASAKTKSTPYGDCIYVGQKSAFVKGVKLLSLTSSVSFTLAMPPFVLNPPISALPLKSKIVFVAAPLLMTYGFSFSLHMVTRSFVHKMYFSRSDKVLTAELRNFFALRSYVRFTIDELPEKVIFDGEFCQFVMKNRKLFLCLHDITDKEVFTALLDRS